MDQELLTRFVDKLKAMNDEQYMISMLKYHLAPTRLHNKPSTIINLGIGEKNLLSLWKTDRESVLKELALDAFELKSTEQNKLILFYNKRRLSSVAFNKDNMNLLKQYGYKDAMTLQEILQHLKSRFKEGCPHEIGILLGFPLKDVEGFIENPKKRNCVYGYWKVYEDVETARKIFHAYDVTRERAIKDILCIYGNVP